MPNPKNKSSSNAIAQSHKPKSSNHQMVDPITEIRTSFTRDEAIAVIAKIELPQWHPLPPDATDEEIEMFQEVKTYDLLEFLREEQDSLTADYHEARSNGQTDLSIQQKRDALVAHGRLVDRIKTIACLFDDEVAKLAKGDPTPLRVDPIRSERKGQAYYTVNSVQALSRGLNSKKSKTMDMLNKTSTGKNIQYQPWFEENPTDPETNSKWITAARYFAREIVKDIPAHQNWNKKSISADIYDSLKRHRIYKRGGKATPSVQSIINALNGVELK